MERCKVIQLHRRTYKDPLIVKTGEQLAIGERDEDYPGWIWCTNKAGKSGWVPESYLSIDGEKGQINRDYSALELTVGEGDMLDVVINESGWLLCENESGERGWVPGENVEILSNSN